MHASVQALGSLVSYDALEGEKERKEGTDCISRASLPTFEIHVVARKCKIGILCGGMEWKEIL